MGSFPITKTLSFLDPETFSNDSKTVIDFIANYYKNIEKYPVQSKVELGYLSTKLPPFAPNFSEPLDEVLNDVTEHILPGLTHWQSPNFFGYFQANASTAGFVGEMLCSGLNVVGFNWISSPAATELESIVLDWIGKMLDLPSEFLFSGSGGGILHGTTCESITCTLAAARDKVLEELGGNGANIAKLVVYSSDQTHFAFEKAAKLIGIPPSNFRSIKTCLSSEFSVSPEKLRFVIEEDIKSGLVPLYLCATVGTTASCAVDPIEELAKIAREFKLWFHIDAAYAGSACVCPEFRHYLNGVEFADSFSMNPHKWLLTNMESCCLWLKEPKWLIHSLSTDPEVLKNSATESNSVVDYKDWQVGLSRRFKALKLWIVMRRHGLSGLMYHIRSDVDMAKYFEEMVVKDKRFEIVVPRKFALVCFRLKPKNESQGTELNSRLLGAVNSSGRAFMSHAVLRGMFIIRCAIGATLTEKRQVDDLWNLIQENAHPLLEQMN